MRGNEPGCEGCGNQCEVRRDGCSMVFAAALLVCAGLTWTPAMAQTGGAGAIQGTVKDSTGAIIPDAKVTARNVATGVETKRTSSSDGLYNIGPLIPGTYEVTVTANGFATFKQENVTIDAMNTLGLNVTLKTGSVSETVTVSDAPPALDTTNSTLGGTIENSVYTALPLLISGSQQRDVTQFSNLLPGAQVNPGGRSSIIGGTGQRLGELYRRWSSDHDTEPAGRQSAGLQHCSAGGDRSDQGRHERFLGGVSGRGS